MHNEVECNDYLSFVSSHTHTRTHARTRARAHTHTHARTHARAHTHTHTHTHHRFSRTTRLIAYNGHVSEPHAPRNLSIETRTGSSLTVTWEPPMSGLLTEYRVYLTGVSGSDQIISTSGTRRTTFTGLTAGTSYTVVVVTRSGDQQSDPLADTFYTSKFFK